VWLCPTLHICHHRFFGLYSDSHRVDSSSHTHTTPPCTLYTLLQTLPSRPPFVTLHFHCQLSDLSCLFLTSRRLTLQVPVSRIVARQCTILLQTLSTEREPTMTCTLLCGLLGLVLTPDYTRLAMGHRDTLSQFLTIQGPSTVACAVSRSNLVKDVVP